MAMKEPVKKLSLSISTWFRIPEQGMAYQEILCRASAFFIRSKNSKYPYKLHLLTASHVVAPWRFPKYYKDEWLSYVNQNHTNYSLEIRDEDGKITAETSLLSDSFHHSSRDLAVLHLDDEDYATRMIEKFGVESQDLLQRQLIEGEVLQFHGHDVSMPSSLSAAGEINDKRHDTEELDERLPKPVLVYGHFATSTACQCFAKTKPILTYGMCGGPVTAKSSTSIRGNGVSETFVTSSVCGMLEGIVPLDSANEQYRGLAAIVDSTVIAE
jgi:hypothetical protein